MAGRLSRERRQNHGFGQYRWSPAAIRTVIWLHSVSVYQCASPALNHVVRENEIVRQGASKEMRKVGGA